jgi:broad specificity phosphatase PhoE
MPDPILTDPLFEQFWLKYPRKIAKRAALLVWLKMTEQEHELALSAIDQHCAYWRAADTSIQFIPHARTWLNQGRWEDEIEIPEPKRDQVREVQWWLSESATIRKGQELGLAPRGGEDWHQFRARIRGALTVADSRSQH